MSQQDKKGPTKFQVALLVAAIATMAFSAAASFFPSFFPFSGEGVMMTGLVSVIISSLLTFWLIFLMATKRKQA